MYNQNGLGIDNPRKYRAHTSTNDLIHSRNKLKQYTSFIRAHAKNRTGIK